MIFIAAAVVILGLAIVGRIYYLRGTHSDPPDWLFILAIGVNLIGGIFCAGILFFPLIHWLFTGQGL
jgi:hypothetical protein